MREAIATQLKTISTFGNRLYQPYTAPSNATTPYGVIKLIENDESFNNKHGEFLGLQIFLYGSKSNFTVLDSLEKEVKTKLDGITLTIDDSPERYFICEYIKTIRDIYDDISTL